MKKLHPHGLLALLLAASAGAVQAQPHQPHHPPALPPESRWAALKAELNLHPSQEAAWAAWTRTMVPFRPAPPPEAPQALSTPERLELMRAQRKVREAEEDRRHAATLALYDVLDPRQKEVFDRLPEPSRGPGTRWLPAGPGAQAEKP